MKEYISIYEGFYGIGKTPEEAYDALNKTISEEGWNPLNQKDIMMYEVSRKGRPVVTVNWE